VGRNSHEIERDQHPGPEQGREGDAQGLLVPQEQQGQGQAGPKQGHDEGQTTTPAHPQGMHERDGQEGQYAQSCDHNQIEPGIGAGEIKIEDHQVPDGWKTAEKMIVRLHILVAEAIKGGGDGKAGGEQFKAFRHHAEAPDGKRRDHGVIEIINHEIKGRAVKAGGHVLHPGEPRQRPVEPVHHQCGTEPEQHDLEITLDQRHKRHQPDDAATCGQRMDGPGGGFLGESERIFFHYFKSSRAVRLGAVHIGCRGVHTFNNQKTTAPMTVMQKISAQRIRPSFVAEVPALDLTKDLSDEEIAAIKDLIHAHGVLIVRGQNNLSDEALLRFAHRFGGLFLVRPPGQEKKAIIRISNLDENGAIQPADHKYRALNAANALWHIDNTYSEPPAKYSMLLGRIVPSSGGETEFADASAAYDALSAEKKAQLDGLGALHSLLHSRALTGFDFSEEERQGLPERERDFIIEHPDTGRKAIGVASHVRVVSGMSEAETRLLLDDLLAHITQPKYLYRHEWVPGDLLIYDNRMVLHRATPYPDMSDPRDLSALRVV